MVTIYAPLLVALVGLLIYLLTTAPPDSPLQRMIEVGRIMFMVGLFVFLFHWAGVTLK